MSDMLMNPAAVLGTQPARASSYISEGVSTSSAWARDIALGTSGGFKPTSPDKNSASLSAQKAG